MVYIISMQVIEIPTYIYSCSVEPCSAILTSAQNILFNKVGNRGVYILLMWTNWMWANVLKTWFRINFKANFPDKHFTLPVFFALNDSLARKRWISKIQKKKNSSPFLLMCFLAFVSFKTKGTTWSRHTRSHRPFLMPSAIPSHYTIYSISNAEMEPIYTWLAVRAMQDVAILIFQLSSYLGPTLLTLLIPLSFIFPLLLNLENNAFPTTRW